MDLQAAFVGKPFTKVALLQKVREMRDSQTGYSGGRPNQFLERRFTEQDLFQPVLEQRAHASS